MSVSIRASNYGETMEKTTAWYSGTQVFRGQETLTPQLVSVSEGGILPPTGLEHAALAVLL